VLDWVPVWNDPTQMSLDTQNGYLYVTNFGGVLLGGNTASVINGTTDSVLATLPVGDDPIASVFDPADGFDYVLNYGATMNLSVLQGTTVHGSIPVGASPSSGLYDPSNGDVYISNSKSGNVSLVNGSVVVRSIPVGTNPGVLSYDPVRQYVYVPNAGSNNVSILNGTRLVATVAVGSSPLSSVYDPANGWTYVVNSVSNNVTVLNGTSLVASVGAGGTPSLGGYDPLDQDVYVTDSGSNSVIVLHGTTVLANVSVGVDPRNVVFDSATGYVYIPNWNTNNVYVLDGTTVVGIVTVGLNPYSAFYDPLNQGVYAVDFNSANLTHLGTPSPSDPLTFTETGLPGGTLWNVDLGNDSYPVQGASVILPESNGTYPFTIPRIPGYAPNTTAVNVTVQGAPVTVTIPFIQTFPIRFHETGLAAGVSWNVTIAPYSNDSSATTLGLTEPNGSYTYTIARIAGYLGNWSGTVNITGMGVQVNLTFVALVYPVRFDETGLTPGTSWSVLVGVLKNSSTTSSIQFQERNGSYAFSISDVAGYSQSPSSGPVFVNGTALTIPIAFSRLYAVNFTESGLPGGSDWAVRIDGQNHSTNASAIDLSLVNGTYPYAISTLASGYAPSVPTGSVHVAGVAIAQPVPFLPTVPPTNYWLYFHAVGLPAGTAWIVHLGGTSNSSVGTTLGFEVENGTYSFTVSANGFAATPLSGNVTVNGPATVKDPVPITFKAIARTILYDLAFVEAGLAHGTGWTVTIGNQSGTSTGGNSIVLREPNGTYAYSLGEVPGYRAIPGVPVIVAGGPVTVPVRFSAALFAVTFQETGLSQGAVWNVSAGGVSNSSSRAALVLWLPNGSYQYSVASVAGYDDVSPGKVVIAGAAPAPVPIAFTRAAPGESTLFGLPSTEGLGIVGVLVVGIAIVLGLLVWRRARGRGGEELYSADAVPDGPVDPASLETDAGESPTDPDR
jgi:YVTN family beta-propeller protein